MSKSKSAAKREKSQTSRGGTKRIKEITAAGLAQQSKLLADIDAKHASADASLEKSSDDAGKVLDFPNGSSIHFGSMVDTTHEASRLLQEKTMHITLTRSARERKSTGVVYNAQGYPGGVRVPKSWFANGEIPDSIVVDSSAFRDASQPKRKLTKEERAALPKLTAAEKLQRAEARLAKLRNKVAQEQAAQLAQPQM